MPEFAEAWDLMLDFIEPRLVRAAYQRAVSGWEEPVFQGGKLVGHRRRYSDAMLRLLLQREWRDRKGAAERDRNGRGTATSAVMPIEEVRALLLKRIAAVERGLARAPDRPEGDRS